mgnify:CR=1 FL=1
MSVSQIQQMSITTSAHSCSIPATVNQVVLSNGNFRVELTLDNGQITIVDLTLINLQISNKPNCKNTPFAYLTPNC